MKRKTETFRPNPLTSEKQRVRLVRPDENITRVFVEIRNLAQAVRILTETVEDLKSDLCQTTLQQNSTLENLFKVAKERGALALDVNT